MNKIEKLKKQKKEIKINRDMSIKELKEIIKKYGVWGEKKENIDKIYDNFEKVEKELFEFNTGKNHIANSKKEMIHENIK